MRSRPSDPQPNDPISSDAPTQTTNVPLEMPPEAPRPKRLQRNAEDRRLQRNAEDRLLLGVCGGLGDYFDIDSNVVRVVFLAGLALAGTSAALYVALALIMPGPTMLDAHPRDAARATFEEARGAAHDARVRLATWLNGLFGKK